MADWRVRIEDNQGPGRPLRFERLAQGLQDGVWGPADQARGPRDAAWVLVGEHPELEEFLPPRPLFRRPSAEDAEMDMTPMIDVTFQLLIFFMIAATYVVQKTLALPPLGGDDEAPATVTMAELASQNIMVRVTDDRSVTVNGAPVALEELGQALRAAAKRQTAGQPEIALDMADDVTQTTVVQVLDAAGAAQIEKVHFISRKRPAGPRAGPGKSAAPPSEEAPLSPSF
ncbi:MAG TPA: biopolymer transporter ExbD [Pirellulales bacterium]|jgi:biopolymer transport protein ExbD|nr:biopolymer transporter ExbD [Pirellulales bacterium]